MNVTLEYLQREPSGRLSYRRRFPKELVRYIPSASPTGRHGLDPRAAKAITGHATSDVHDKTYMASLSDHVDVLSRELEKIPRFNVM